MDKEKKEIIEYLNLKTNSGYSLDNPDTNYFLGELLKAGYTVQDIKKVIDYKWKEWSGTEMQIYCRPTTLLRMVNFIRYHNQVRKKNGIQRLAETVAKSKLFNWRLDKK
jgi:uncharacterized phage protein (TIGR02220 family)